MGRYRFSQLDKKVDQAMKSAVRKVVEDHRRTGIPLAIWKDGKVAEVSAKRLKLT